MAERAGLSVARMEEAEIAWESKTREEFIAFSRATFVNWTMLLPESERDSFIIDVLDRFRADTADPSAEDNTFRFRQMKVMFTPAGKPED